MDILSPKMSVHDRRGGSSSCALVGIAGTPKISPSRPFFVMARKGTPCEQRRRAARAKAYHQAKQLAIEQQQITLTPATSTQVELCPATDPAGPHVQLLPAKADDAFEPPDYGGDSSEHEDLSEQDDQSDNKQTADKARSRSPRGKSGEADAGNEQSTRQQWTNRQWRSYQFRQSQWRGGNWHWQRDQRHQQWNWGKHGGNNQGGWTRDEWAVDNATDSGSGQQCRSAVSNFEQWPPLPDHPPKRAAVTNVEPYAFTSSKSVSMAVPAYSNGGGGFGAYGGTKPMPTKKQFLHYPRDVPKGPPPARSLTPEVPPRRVATPMAKAASLVATNSAASSSNMLAALVLASEGLASLQRTLT